MAEERRMLCIQDYEDHAASALAPLIYEYYRGGADQEQTLRDNRDAFKRYFSVLFLVGVEITRFQSPDGVLCPGCFAEPANETRRRLRSGDA